MKTKKITTCFLFLSLLWNIENVCADGGKTKNASKHPKSIDLKQILTKKSPAWNLTADQFEKKWKPFFKWLNKNKKTAARFQAINSPHKLTISGIRVWEAVIRFKDDKFNRM